MEFTCEVFTDWTLILTFSSTLFFLVCFDFTGEELDCTGPLVSTRLPFLELRSLVVGELSMGEVKRSRDDCVFVELVLLDDFETTPDTVSLLDVLVLTPEISPRVFLLLEDKAREGLFIFSTVERFDVCERSGMETLLVTLIVEPAESLLKESSS